jgi:predicted transposase YbfD/YdcC
MTPWEKEHWRCERRGIARESVDPESIGFPGARQVIAVRRECIELDPRLEEAKLDENASEKKGRKVKGKGKGKGKKYKDRHEIGYYISSVPIEAVSDMEMLEVIRGHWSGIENGTHWLRDVSLGEDACRIAKRNGAWAMASLRNLAIALYELAVEHGEFVAVGFKSWIRQMTFPLAVSLFSM